MTTKSNYRSKVYQVIGSSGSYSDHVEETIIIFQEEEMAKRLVAILTSVVKLYDEAKKGFISERFDFDYNEYNSKLNKLSKQSPSPSEEMKRNLKSSDKAVKKQANKEWEQIIKNWNESDECALMLKHRDLLYSRSSEHNKKERDRFIEYITQVECKDEDVRKALLFQLEKCAETINSDLNEHYDYSGIELVSNIDENISDTDLLKLVAAEVS